MLRRPREAAHVLGKLLVALGPERIVWGTDCAWYGSPQPLIDALRAFVIPDDMQAEFGYPALTAATKERILSANGQELYGFTAAPRVDGAWAANASAELRSAVTAAGLASGASG
jgi:predicted TIM-barrel fold metal-dependent hydrolase